MKIDNYVVDGEAKDHEWIIANRNMLEDYMRQDMRDNGWAPVLDHSIDITWEYVAETKTFKYKMVSKGARIGKKRAKDCIGITDGLLISNNNVSLV